MLRIYKNEIGIDYLKAHLIKAEKTAENAAARFKNLSVSGIANEDVLANADIGSGLADADVNVTKKRISDPPGYPFYSEETIQGVISGYLPLPVEVGGKI